MITTDQLAAELRRAGLREVDITTRRRAEYSTDASLYRVVPQAVVYPRNAEEVALALGVCREVGVPFTPRGAGTSIAGNAVGAGVVADLRRHLDKIVKIEPEARRAVVQPGLVLDALQAAAKPHGLRFGADPSSHNRCTIGGMIGNNACGTHAMAYGRTADNVLELEAVTGAGERIKATKGPLPPALQRVVTENLATIRTELGRFRRQVSGYSLEHLLPENGSDLAKALVGTEGTCAVVLEATLNLVPLPTATTLVVLGYPDMATAADAVPDLLLLGPIAIEGLDHRIVDVVRARKGSVPALPPGRGWLFVEVDNGNPGPIAQLAPSRIVTDPAEAATLWKIREDGAGLSGTSPAGRPAWAGWEDAAVPPERLGAYLREFDALMESHGLTGMPYGHFGDGCVHVRIDFPLDADTRLFETFLTQAARLVASHGGSMSGEHGDGRARGALLPIMYSPAAIAAFAAVKDVFDPHDVLNPGVIVRPRPLAADLRRPAAGRNDFATAVHRCTGVGKCTADTGGVMCPSYLATRDEKDSTRGRARVLQEMVNGTLVTGGWRAPEVEESLDLCLACKGCASDCPAGVDMATWKAEVLHRKYKGRIRPRTHYSLGWLPLWARLATLAPLIPRLANAVAGTGLAKRLAGIDIRRPLPHFAKRKRIRTTRTDGDPVVLWVDTFTEHFAPEIAAAAVRVLESAGFAVRTPSRRVCCGLTLTSTGQFAAARRRLRRGLAALLDAAPAGVEVVGLEPSCVASLRSDARELLDPDDPLLAMTDRVRTLAEVLAGRDVPGLRGLDVLAQPHCHHHAVLGWDADRALLERAGARVTRVAGCCGLAGNFGMDHYDVSVAVAETHLLPAVRAAAPGTELLADGFSCRTQLDHLTGRPARHLAQLLDAASTEGMS